MEAYHPRRPALLALALHTVWIAVLSLPMWSGKFLAGPWSDQYATGYAFRHWIAQTWLSLGQLPMWNPLIFGGLPLAAGHGDAFYPTALLRLVLPTDVAMNLAFVGHYVLAGWMTYLFLRALRVSWVGAVVGGLAYQLTGVVASLVSPGHDGKLYVSALLPLSLLSLVLALRHRRFEGYGLLALAVGLALLSPHYQMVYYLLVTAGIFALYLVFGEPERRPFPRALADLGLALGAVIVGFGIAAIQVWPFVEYLPYSPRAQGYGGFQDSASFGIPWDHLPELFLAGFAGALDEYWGSNYFKLHSEYLGLPVVALAVLGASGPRRRLVYWLGGAGLLFLLVAMSDSTPFYRLWWEVMPFVKQTRAAGMAFYVPSFVVASFAAFGAERLEAGQGRNHVFLWLVAGAAVALMGVTGIIGGLAQALAQTVPPLPNGRLPAEIAARASDTIRMTTSLSGVALLMVAGLGLLWLKGRVPRMAFATALPLLVGADLWRNAERFWVWSDIEPELFRPDSVTEALSGGATPLRALQIPSRELEVYPGSALMAHGVPQLLGHHGNELHTFDELLGGRNRWSYVFQPRVWELYAVNWLVLPSGVAGQIPGLLDAYEPVLREVPTTPGVTADLYRRRQPYPYARLVPAALKAPDERAIPTIVDPRTAFDPARLVILPPDAPVREEAFTGLPQPLPVQARVTAWQPGRIEVLLEPRAPQDAYLVVSENWYRDWQATVDGEPTATFRGNVALLTAAVPQGARSVTFAFESRAYRRGRLLTVMSLVIAALALVGPELWRRGRRG